MPDHAKALEYAQMEVELARLGYNMNNPAINSTRVMLAQAYLDLHQQLAEARKEQQWQPIETAPMDGTDLLLWTGWAITGKWDSKRNNWVTEDGTNTIYMVTHWAKIPCPPLDATQEKV
jgi:hypothetical protein